MTELVTLTIVVEVAHDLIGTSEAARRLRVERSTLLRWVQLGRLTPALKLPGQTGSMLFDPDYIDAYEVPESVRRRQMKAAS